jgi:diketogulonate reductase-like aldo/keto reductase
MIRLGHLTRRDFIGRLAGAAALLGAPGTLGSMVSSAQQTMPVRAIPGTGERLPIVGFGSSKAVLEIPEEGVDPIELVIRVLLERGGRVVDTSPRPEEIDLEFGRVLQSPGLRDRIFLATKINSDDAETGVAHMRQNQRLFGRRTLDLVQIESLRGLADHWPRLRAWKDSGEARYVGVTVQNAGSYEQLEAFMRAEPADFVHVNYSVLETQAEERILPLARDRGMAVFINRPFMNGGYFGRVSGRELPAWAADFDCHAWSQFSLKYILANPAVTCVLTETTNPEHMEENIGAAFGRFPDAAQLERMRTLARTL